MKNQLFLSVLILLVFSPFSQSEEFAPPFFKGLSSKLMDLLNKEDIDGYRQLRQDVSKVFFDRMFFVEREILDRYRVRKAFAAVDEQGNNILHSLIHLEQSEALKYESDEMESLLTEELGAFFRLLLAKKFSQLLLQENNHGVSPLQKAAASKGAAYEALRAVIKENNHFFRSDLDSIGSIVFIAAGGLLFSEGNIPAVAAGIASIAYGANLCHTAFAKSRNLREINEQLFSPIVL